MKRVVFMSTLKRFDLLVPHLDCLDEAWPLGDDIINIDDVYTVRQAFKTWVTLASDILFNLGYSAPSVINRLTSLIKALVSSTQPSKWLSASKVAYDTFILIISKKVPINTNLYVDFKDQLAALDVDPGIISALVAPINQVMSSIKEVGYINNGCWRCEYSDAICACAQYFGFLMKLEISRPDLEQKALEDYIAFEANYFDQDPQLNPYAHCLKTILNEWLKDFKYDGTLCRNGNGSVANANRSALIKFQSMESDMRLDYLFKRFEINALSDYLPLPLSEGTLERCSKLQFVPKNISKLRSISMEPAALQFVQQGVMQKLYKFIAHHPKMSKHIKLDNQEQNKSYAYDGSITDNYSTIDLSAASDSIPYNLAHFLFSDLPEVWRWLVGTRSDHTLLPTGDKLFLKKFAPMGSAVCFPIETLIFAAIAELSTQLGRERGLTQDALTGVYTMFYTVYGDDIIIPRGIYNLTCEILNSFGFSINRSKSFDSSPFKESCGGNYHCGRDLTPIKWTVQLSKSNKLSVDGYSAICTIVNSLYLKGYKITRCYLLKLIQGFGYTPLFTDRFDQSPMIYSPAPTNFHCKTRYRNDLQCVEKQYTVLKTSLLTQPTKEVEQLIDTVLYFQWLRSHAEKSEPGVKKLFVPLKNGANIFVLNEDPPLTRKSILMTKSVKGRGYSFS